MPWTCKERRVVTVELAFYFHFAFSSVLGMGGIFEGGGGWGGKTFEILGGASTPLSPPPSAPACYGGYIFFMEETGGLVVK